METSQKIESFSNKAFEKPVKKGHSIVTIKTSSIWSTKSSSSESPVEKSKELMSPSLPSTSPSFSESRKAVNQENFLTKAEKYNSNDSSDLYMTSTYEESKKKRKFLKANSLNNESNNEHNRMMSFKDYAEEVDLFQKEEKLPDKIEGTYVFDYNILNIDDIIKKKFRQEKKKHVGLLKEKIKLEEAKTLTRQTLIERKATRKRIDMLQKELDDYTNNNKKLEYIEKTKELIQEYKNIGPINNIVSFISNNKEEQEMTLPESDEQQSLRQRIIWDYLEIARNYIIIDLLRQRLDINACPGCGVKYSEIEMIEDESGSNICGACGLEKINVVKNPFFADGNRVNNSRNNYEDRANFERAIMRYQGKQKTKPNIELYSKLDEYFISKGMKCSKEIHLLPLKDDGTKEGTNKEMMYEALNQIGCSGYYEDINLICAVFWGWTLHDISYLEEQLMQDYDDSQRVYEELDKEGRKSSLNSQFRLYCLLRKNGLPVKSKDFKIPSTPVILEYHKNQWKKICKALGWEYIF